MVHNNLCPVCEAKRLAGEDITGITERLKINPRMKGSDTILVCIHDGDCSIMDIAVCSCGKRGFILTPEEQIGILTERNDLLEQIQIDLDPENRGLYCSSCGSISACSKCGRESRRKTDVFLADGTQLSLCSDCIRLYRKCTVCNGHHTEYNSVLDCYICSVCAPNFVRCSCGSLVKQEQITEWVDGENVCPRCAVNGTCAWCNRRGIVRNSNNDMLCKEHTIMFKDITTVEGYHHTKVHQYLKADNEGKSVCFLGIEWEAQVNITNKKFLPRTVNLRRRLLAHEVKKLFPEAETKRDGSLCMKYLHTPYENGVESVWQPMTFEYINKNRNKFKELFKKVKPMLHKDMPQSGMHIHISKKAFTPFHFLKFTNFFYTQEKQGFLYHMARRMSNSYSKIKSSFSYDGNKYSIKQTGIRAALYHQAQLGKTIKLSHQRSFYPERYDILNITNQHTFEIRAFKSPTKYEDFMANIEYVYAMYLYTKDVSANDMSLEDFFKYVTNNASKFPELVNKINSFKGGN